MVLLCEGRTLRVFESENGGFYGGFSAGFLGGFVGFYIVGFVSR